MKNIVYMIVGIVFGLTLIKSQVISWYRIQEMFLFDSFHMYGVIGIAIITASIGIIALKKHQSTSSQNIPITVPKKN